MNGKNDKNIESIKNNIAFIVLDVINGSTAVDCVMVPENAPSFSAIIVDHDSEPVEDQVVYAYDNEDCLVYPGRVVHLNALDYADYIKAVSSNSIMDELSFKEFESNNKKIDNNVVFIHIVNGVVTNVSTQGEFEDLLFLVFDYDTDEDDSDIKIKTIHGTCLLYAPNNK